MHDSDKRLQIAFLTPQDPLSKRTWSGTTCAMARALQKQCGDVTFLGPVPAKQIGGKLYNRLVRFLLRKRYDYSHSLPYAEKCATFFAKQLKGRSFDIIFAPAAATGLAYLQTTIPIVYASDCTFALLQNYYPEFTNLLETSVRAGYRIEKAAINNARISLFSSEWAAQSAVTDYGAVPANTRVIPFGANIDEIPLKHVVLKRDKSERLRLLFLAVNWLRKGGDIALETLISLTGRGIDAELIVCGCIPPPGISHERMTVIPFLSKDDPVQCQALAGLFGTSDFLLLPTRYDCTPIVFCEANAYGMPVITADTGGVSGMIRNNENGIMLPASAGGKEYAEIIYGLYQDDHRFRELRRSSRAAFDSRLNWDSWAFSVKALFHEVLGSTCGNDSREEAPAP